MVVNNLPSAKTKHLRRLARYLKIKSWYRLRRAQLIEEITWELDPWKDVGMY